MSKVIKETTSLCPECRKKLKAKILEEKGSVWIEKKCNKHGNYKELYFGDAEMYKKFKKYSYPKKKILNPNMKSTKNCPFDCGLCTNHKSNTCLANIAITNVCDLRCWYCFYYAKEGSNIYEPSLKQIEDMLKVGRKEKPVPPTAIQLTGGEPTLRKDLLDIIKLCKKQGYTHIQLNTNGINLAFNRKLTKDIRREGINTIYLSFDGISKKTNPKNHWEIPYTFDNFRKAKLSVVLVPTVIKGVNDQEVGDIVNFALNNLDVVRGIDFQPVSLVGRMPRKDREKQRITIPDVIKKLEEQTNGAIGRKDFYPIPVVYPITRFVEAVTKKPKYALSSYYACGAATYLFLDGDKPVPITRFVDVEGFFEYINEKAEEIEKGKNKKIVYSKMLLNLRKFINKEKQPKNLNLSKLLFNALIKHDYKALGDFHRKTLFVGMMHFMDLYNYDVERVQKCVIHYLMPNNKIVPFCTFNVLPEFYRDKVQEEFSIPAKKWEEQKGKKLKDYIYKRDIKKLESGKLYKQTYNNLRNFFN
jgi:hypothetical protein